MSISERLITAEMGKPLAEALAEVAKSAFGCEHYAEHAAEYLADRPVPTDSIESYVSYTPLGVVLAIMPWNFPFWQAFRAGVPILMAGNGIVLKHASNVPQCALAVEEVFRDAGFPEGLVRTVLVNGEDADALVTDARIAGVTLTGSSEVGARVASLAAGQLKKQVLELGGSDPFIVLADADLDAAARVGARARNQNSGQSRNRSPTPLPIDSRKPLAPFVSVIRCCRRPTWGPWRALTFVTPSSARSLSRSTRARGWWSVERDPAGRASSMHRPSSTA